MLIVTQPPPPPPPPAWLHREQAICFLCSLCFLYNLLLQKCIFAMHFRQHIYFFAFLCTFYSSFDFFFYCKFCLHTFVTFYVFSAPFCSPLPQVPTVNPKHLPEGWKMKSEEESPPRVSSLMQINGETKCD